MVSDVCRAHHTLHTRVHGSADLAAVYDSSVPLHYLRPMAMSDFLQFIPLAAMQSRRCLEQSDSERMLSQTTLRTDSKT
jgi:hypothetical protein